MKRIAIIGAGISGLSCARELQANGWKTTVFEKSRSLGGRCATRRWEEHIVDHGAQYFTIRNAAFEAAIGELCGEWIRPISASVHDLDEGELPVRGPRFYHLHGNNRLGKALAEGLDVRQQTHLPAGSLRQFEGELMGESFDCVVCTIPFPQACVLLGRPEPPISYTRCLTAFFSYDQEPGGVSASRYGLRDTNGALAWSACENHKRDRIRAGQSVFVAQASREFSAAYFETSPEVWTAKLRSQLEEYWEVSMKRRKAWFTHRWGFARRVSPTTVGALPEGVFIAGDSVTESRIESVWLSGAKMARELMEKK